MFFYGKSDQQLLIMDSIRWCEQWFASFFLDVHAALVDHTPLLAQLHSLRVVPAEKVEVQYLLSMFKIDPEMRRGARAPPPPHSPTPPSADRHRLARAAQARRYFSRRRTTTSRW